MVSCDFARLTGSISKLQPFATPQPRSVFDVPPQSTTSMNLHFFTCITTLPPCEQHYFFHPHGAQCQASRGCAFERAKVLLLGVSHPSCNRGSTANLARSRQLPLPTFVTDNISHKISTGAPCPCTPSWIRGTFPLTTSEITVARSYGSSTTSWTTPSSQRSARSTTANTSWYRKDQSVSSTCYHPSSSTKYSGCSTFQPWLLFGASTNELCFSSTLCRHIDDCGRYAPPFCVRWSASTPPPSAARLSSRC